MWHSVILSVCEPRWSQNNSRLKVKPLLDFLSTNIPGKLTSQKSEFLKRKEQRTCVSIPTYFIWQKKNNNSQSHCLSCWHRVEVCPFWLFLDACVAMLSQFNSLWNDITSMSTWLRYWGKMRCCSFFSRCGFLRCFGTALLLRRAEIFVTNLTHPKAWGNRENNE